MTDSFRDQLQTALAPHYTIDRELAGGGMSRVFVAVEHALSRTVVVKVLKPDLAAGVNRERFRREIIFVAQLQHPHIVPVLNAGEHGDLIWYTMPFVEGDSLREALAEGQKFSPRDVVRVLHDVLDALAYAHRRGVIHRDIKPGNILRHGTHSLVTDFGVAKALSASLPHSGTTSVGIAIGTPAYMAPEQLAADPSADHRMDLYAVGLLAYELLTGAQPFGGGSPQATMAAQLTRMPTPLEECCPGVPPQLAALVMRLLAKQPDDRPQTAEAALDELEALPISSGSSTAVSAGTSNEPPITPVPGAMRGGTPAATTVPLSTNPVSRTGNRWRVAVLAAAGIALAAVGVAVGRTFTVDSRRQTALAADSARVANTPVPVPLPKSLTRADSLRIADAVRKQVATVRQTDARRPGPDHNLDSLQRILVRVYTDSAVQQSLAEQERARVLVRSQLAGIGDTIAAAMRAMERQGITLPRPARPETPSERAVERARARATLAAPSAPASARASASVAPPPRVAPPRLTAGGKPMRVAVLPVRDGTARPALAPVARALEDSLKRALANAGFALATDGELVRLMAQGDMTSQRRMAESAGIGAVITTVLTARDDELIAQGIVLDVWRGYPMSEREAAGFDQPEESFGVVRDIVRALERVSWRTREDPRRLLIYDIENQTGVDSLSAVARQISDTLRSALPKRLEGGVVVVTDSAARATVGTSERRLIGGRYGAGAIVAGAISRARGDSINLRLTARDMTEERSFASFDLRIARASLSEGLAMAMDRLTADLIKVNWGPKGALTP